MKKHKYSIRFGVLAGFAVVIYMLVFYFYDPKVMLSPEVFWSTTILYLVGMLLAGRESRQEQGAMSFRELLPIIFTTYMIANLFFYDFLYILFNFVDPALPELQKQLGIQNIKEMGLDSYVQEEIEAIENEKATFTLGQAFFSYLRSAIGGFILSVVLAFALRNK